MRQDDDRMDYPVSYAIRHDGNPRPPEDPSTFIAPTGYLMAEYLGRIEAIEENLLELEMDKPGWSKPQKRVIQELQGQVLYLQGKVNELTAKKRPQRKLGLTALDS